MIKISRLYIERVLLEKASHNALAVTAQNVTGKILEIVGGMDTRGHVAGAGDQNLRIASPIKTHVLVVCSIECSLEQERIELLVLAGRMVQQHLVFFTNCEFSL
jgi:hypothetical protein